MITTARPWTCDGRNGAGGARRRLTTVVRSSSAAATLIAIEAEYLRRPFSGVQDHTCQHLRSDGVEAVLEGGDNTEVAPTASKPPKKVGVLALAHAKEPPI